MGLKISLHNIVIPLSVFDARGVDFSEYLHENKSRLGTQIDFDNQLYIERAFFPDKVDELVEYWRSQGIHIPKYDIYATSTDEFCIVTSSNSLIIPCDWLSYDKSTKLLQYSGSKPETLSAYATDSLIGEAYEVDEILTSMISIHNKLQREVGSIWSLLRIFKRHDFSTHSKESVKIVERLNTKMLWYKKLKESACYSSFCQQEQEFFDCLLLYSDALHKTATALQDLTEALYEKSISAKNGVTWAQYRHLDKQYQLSISCYVQYGGELNKLYDKLQASRARV